MKTLLIIGILFLTSCTIKDSDYIEIEPEVLKKEILTTTAPSGMLCDWSYSYKKEYHRFKFLCQPNKKPLGSVLEIIKIYKVKKTKLKVTTDNLPEGAGTPIEYVKIH
jgi:hypothetical protein